MLGGGHASPREGPKFRREERVALETTPRASQYYNYEEWASEGRHSRDSNRLPAQRFFAPCH